MDICTSHKKGSENKNVVFQPLESGRIHIETTGAPGRRLVGHHVGRVPGQVPHEVSPEGPDCWETIEASLGSVHPTGHQAGSGSAVVGSRFGAKQQLPKKQHISFHLLVGGRLVARRHMKE